jgi:hypothetical protein
MLRKGQKYEKNCFDKLLYTEELKELIKTGTREIN